MRGLLNCSVLYGSSTIIQESATEDAINDKGTYQWHILYLALCYTLVSDYTFSEFRTESLPVNGGIDW